MSERLYRVHLVHKDGRHTVMGQHLMTHQEAVTLKSKLCDRTRPDCLLVEGQPHPCVGHDPANARKGDMGPYCLECLEEIAEAAAKVTRKARDRTRQTRCI